MSWLAIGLIIGGLILGPEDRGQILATLGILLVTVWLLSQVVGWLL